MSKTKKAEPFDAVAAAVKFRGRQLDLSTLPIEQQIATRQELRHTGALRTKLLRRSGDTARPLQATAHRSNNRCPHSTTSDLEKRAHFGTEPQFEGTRTLMSS